MTIENISLKNFRSHTNQSFSFSNGTTIIVGKNASGKTNLLEAIYFLSIGKSFRLGRDVQAIGFGHTMARITADVTVSEENRKLEIVLTPGEVAGMKSPFKKFLVNDVPKRSIDFTAILKSVLFWPEDMELVTDSPSLRRRYMDFVLMQTDREYRRTLISYERGLRQRNKLLEAIREGQAHEHQLIFWNQLLVKQGEYLTVKREELINYVNGFSLKALSKSGISFRLFYDKSIISQQRLDQYSQAETAAGVTLVGPHRDDMKFTLHKENESDPEKYRELENFGSRGEQRLAVLWLKLAELDFVKSKTRENPILLLDDIFSELDHEHREIIFSLIGNQQSILTVTDRHLIPEKHFSEARVIELN